MKYIAQYLNMGNDTKVYREVEAEDEKEAREKATLVEAYLWLEKVTLESEAERLQERADERREEIPQ